MDYFVLILILSDGKREFYIYNLTTSKCRLIPLPDTIDEPNFMKTMNLAFDPEKSQRITMLYEFGCLCLRIKFASQCNLQVMWYGVILDLIR